MKSFASHIELAADAPIDLQMHTIYSDGTWTPERLVDYLISEQFGLVAITDHDRVDTASMLQQLAAAKGFPILTAVEMSTTWRGESTDVLCFGFDPEENALSALAQEVTRRQSENTRDTYEKLCQQGYIQANQQELDALLGKPSSRHFIELATLLEKHTHGADEQALYRRLEEFGFTWITTDIAAVVDAAHRSGGVSLLAHPGRGEFWTRYDERLLDELCQEVPIDGFEAYYPKHTPEQTAMYLAYAEKHNLLVSSGSDSHGPERPPIKYRAELSRKLLERLGVRFRA